MNELKSGLIVCTLLGSLCSFLWFLNAHSNNKDTEGTIAAMSLFGTTFTCGSLVGSLNNKE